MWTTNRRDGGRWGTWAGVVPAARAGGRADPPGHGGRPAGLRRHPLHRRRGHRRRTVRRTTEVIRAGRVIVCAGAYGSPELLLRSGIGPEAGAGRGWGPSRSRCWPGVGANVQDHPWCLLNVDVTDPALIEARPVSGALLRYELADPRAEHVEAEIFPWQRGPTTWPRRPPRVSFTAALMAPRSRGRSAHARRAASCASAAGRRRGRRGHGLDRGETAELLECPGQGRRGHRPRRTRGGAAGDAAWRRLPRRP